MVATIWRFRREYSVAYLEVYSGRAFFWAETCAFVLRILNKPIIAVLHGGGLPDFAKRWPKRVSNLLRHAEIVATPSRFVRFSLCHYRADIVLLPNAIDLTAYRFHLRSAAAPRMAWLRAFHSIYAPQTATQVLGLLVNEFPEIDLVMYGPDKNDGTFRIARAIAESAGVAAQVHTPGAIVKSDVPLKLGEHDIFLNTTTAESFGVSVVEAAALGMCIVTTNVGELPYIWTHEYDALLVPPNDPEAMAAAVRRILTEPGLAERLSRNARKTAEQFDWSVILPQWEALLTDVAEGRRCG